MSENREDEQLLLEEFSIDLANGNLSGDLKVKGTIAGSLKSLQSSLRHLSWQAKQVAEGDFSQRVDFMGEFSDSFNYMVMELEKSVKEREEREKRLSLINIQLTNEIEKRIKAEESLLNTSSTFRNITALTRHDIKNQLTALNAYLEILSENIDNPEENIYLNNAGEIANKIFNLINFTREFDNIGIGGFFWLDLREIIEKAITEFKDKNINFLNEISDVEIYNDPLIEKVFYNLIENSLHHGERVSEISFSCQEKNKNLILYYTDDGVGIPSIEKPKIFFKGFGKNTGLGMYFTREILTASRLEIDEIGTPGDGVIFKITVPEDVYRNRNSDDKYLSLFKSKLQNS